MKKWYNVELGQENAERLGAYLKKYEYKYEASACGIWSAHFEIYLNKDAASKVDFLFVVCRNFERRIYMTHSDFLAKTFVAQAKAYKRFRIEGMYYSALDTLNHAYDDKIITCSEWHKAHEYFHNFIYE